MFHPVEIDTPPAYGWQGGPNIDVLIKTLRNRHEKRNKVTDYAQHSYTLPFQNLRSATYLAYIKSAFMAMGGPENSFLVKDYGDFEAFDEVIGLAPAGSAPVQLLRTYTPWDFPGAPSFSRVITKPIAEGFVYSNGLIVPAAVISQNGVPVAGELDPLTGLFTPDAAWTASAVLTWTGEFRVPVRFDSMMLPSTIDNRSGKDHIVNGSVSLLEVFGE